MPTSCDDHLAEVFAASTVQPVPGGTLLANQVPIGMQLGQCWLWLLLAVVLIRNGQFEVQSSPAGSRTAGDKFQYAEGRS